MQSGMACSVQWRSWIFGVGLGYMSLYGYRRDIDKEKKVEILPRSKKKNRKLVIVEYAILVTCPRFSSLLSYFFLSGITVSPVIYLFSPTLVSQWLPFSLDLSPSFQQNQHYVIQSGRGSKRKMLGRYLQLINFSDWPGITECPIVPELMLRPGDLKHFHRTFSQKTHSLGVRELKGIWKTTIHGDWCYRSTQGWGNTDCLNFNRVRTEPWKEITEGPKEEVTS